MIDIIPHFDRVDLTVDQLERTVLLTLIGNC